LLGISRHRKRCQAGRKQPNRLAHGNPPRLDSYYLASGVIGKAFAAKRSCLFTGEKAGRLRQKCHMMRRNMKKARLP
jgi:hypothetical protein